jgi:predicted RNase H-like HicB family nuclease
MRDITFVVHRAEEGGFWAEAIGHALYTQAETLDELSAMVEDAVECFFEDEVERPTEITWRFAREKLAA